MELECEGERVESIVLYGNKGTVWIAIANDRRPGVSGVRETPRGQMMLASARAIPNPRSGEDKRLNEPASN